MAVTSMSKSSISAFAKSNQASAFSGPFKATVSGTTGSPTITTDGSATIYTFTGDGTITFSREGFVDLLVLGGGAGGGSSVGDSAGGGGGAGGFALFPNHIVPSGATSVTIGAGGAAGSGKGFSGGITTFGVLDVGPGGGGGGADGSGVDGVSGISGGGGGGATFLFGSRFLGCWSFLVALLLVGLFLVAWSAIDCSRLYGRNQFASRQGA